MNPNTPPHHSITPILRVWLLSLLFLSSFIPHPSSFAAESPLVIPFQGQITNQQNALVATGQYSIIFNLYDVAVGGQPLWTERHSKVGVVNGMVNVFLGSITSIAAVDFSQTRYLGITVDVDDKPTTADPEMVPRQMIIPAFHAKKAENATKLAGFDWTSILTGGANDPSSATLRGDKLADASVTTVKLATNAVQTAQVQDAAITSAKIADGTITSSDLSAALQADSVNPTGIVSAFAGTVAPTGWAFCDGSSQLRTDPVYSRLYGVISTAHGAVDATHFNLPDYRGRFLRGVDGTAGNDPDKTTRPAMATGGNTGNSVGTLQTDAFANHSHDQKIGQNVAGGQYGYGTSGATPNSFQTVTQTGSAGSSNETRPKNAYVNYIIKL